MHLFPLKTSHLIKQETFFSTKPLHRSVCWRFGATFWHHGIFHLHDTQVELNCLKEEKLYCYYTIVPVNF